MALLELPVDLSLDISFVRDIIAHLSEIHQEVTLHAVSHNDLPILLALLQVLLVTDCVLEVA